MKPYIPKQTRLTRERVEAKLEQSLVRSLERYCVFLDSDRDYVIAQALEIAFHKDKAFQEWLKKPQRAADEMPADTAKTMPHRESVR